MIGVVGRANWNVVFVVSNSRLFNWTDFNVKANNLRRLMKHQLSPVIRHLCKV